MFTPSKKCQDSGAQVTYPVTGLEAVVGKDFAYCGCCGSIRES